MIDGSYSSEIYDVVCQANTDCKYQMQNIDLGTMSNMTAVPFILDIFGNGTVGIFIFKGAQRFIVSYTSNKKAL